MLACAKMPSRRKTSLKVLARLQTGIGQHVFSHVDCALAVRRLCVDCGGLCVRILAHTLASPRGARGPGEESAQVCTSLQNGHGPPNPPQNRTEGRKGRTEGGKGREPAGRMEGAQQARGEEGRENEARKAERELVGLQQGGLGLSQRDNI